MKQFFIVILIAAALMASAGAGVAIAQDDATDPAEDVAEDDREDVDEPSEVVVQLDPTVRVVDVEWGETTTVTLESTEDEWKDVTVTDISPIDDEGGHQVDSEQVRLRGEETVAVEIVLEDPDNPKLSMSTGEGTALLVGDSGGFNPFAGESATWGLVQVGALWAAIGSVSAFGLFGWHRIASRHDTADLVKP